MLLLVVLLFNFLASISFGSPSNLLNTSQSARKDLINKDIYRDCRSLFDHKKFYLSKHGIDLLYQLTHSSQINTTSLRQESKFVLKDLQSESILKRLKIFLGPKIKLRDKPLNESVNITETYYSVPFQWENNNGDTLSGKIRFRKYFTQPLLSNDKKELDFIKDRQFVELKIDHQDYAHVVLKPRLVILDKDQSLMLSRTSYLKHREEIKLRTKELKKINSNNLENNESTVEDFFNLWDYLYQVHSFDHWPMYAKTIYQRESYSMILDPINRFDDPDHKAMEVQLTIDKKIKIISLQDFADEQNISYIDDFYGADESVVEVKIPIFLAQKPVDSVISLYPDYYHIVKAMDDLKKYHLKDYNMNSGKLYRFKTEFIKEENSK